MRHPAIGFTLIEMMIALTVLAILLGLALPSFTAMMRNGKVRAAAESALAGLQLARSEAIKRNLQVSFAFIDNNPTSIGTVAPAFSSVSAGRNWAVYVDDGTRRELIDSRPAIEGGQSTVKIEIDLPGVPASAPTRVSFDSLGRPVGLDNIGRLDFSDGAVACEHAGGTVRCLRVAVSPGGSVRLCDPKVTAAADTRVCP